MPLKGKGLTNCKSVDCKSYQPIPAEQPPKQTLTLLRVGQQETEDVCVNFEHALQIKIA